MKEFKDMLEKNEVLKEFDRFVFESIVEKVIVGEIDQNNNVDPYKLTFVYKTGFKDNLDGSKCKVSRKNESEKHKKDREESSKLCSHTNGKVNKLYSYSCDETRGDSSIDVKSAEIGLFKTLANKRFSGLEDFLPCQ